MGATCKGLGACKEEQELVSEGKIAASGERRYDSQRNTRTFLRVGNARKGF